MRISINANGDALRDAGNYVNFLQKLKPPALLQIENSALAQQLAIDLPQTRVILRRYPDPTPGMSPENWLNANINFGKGGVWLNALNEPGFSEKAIDWCVRLMDLAIGRDVHLVVGNFGIGSFEQSEVAMLRPILWRCSLNPDKFMLGLHEYFAGHIASGLGGGQEARMIQPDSWPLGQFAQDITRYHVGRHKWICDWARANAYGAARIVITEFGADRLDDVKTWQQSLIKTQGYDQIRGYHTLAAQWKAWYPQWDTARAYYEMLRYADEQLLDEMVVAACVFAWNTNPDWVQFDVSNDTEWQAIMLAASNSQPPQPPPLEPPPLPPQPPPPPTPGPDQVLVNREDVLKAIEILESLTAILKQMVA